MPSQAKRVAVLRLLPTAAERPVELHETLILVASRLCQSELRVEERSLAVQHFKIRDEGLKHCACQSCAPIDIASTG
jgi:hypothetical protein